MKKIRTLKPYGLVLAAVLLGSASVVMSQTLATNIVNTFDTGTEGVAPAGSGIWYGSSQITWDNSADNTGNGGGSLYVSTTFGSSSDTPMSEYICFPPYDNLWYNGNPPGVPLSQYLYVQFDILWDTNASTLGIDQFNTLDTWPANQLQSWAPANYLAGSIDGLSVCVAGLGSTSPEPVQLGDINIPEAASNGWVTITIPINQSMAGIDGAAGLFFHKWINQQWGISGSWMANFWIDNVQFVESVIPPAPPTMAFPTKPTPGLNVFASTEGNTYYDRQEVMLVSSNGLSWVGNATAANPVTYSLTINGFPQSAATENACEAYMFLVPNPAYPDNAPDWNETNCITVQIEQGAGTTTMNLVCKTNQPQQASTAVTLGSVTYTGTALGTWSIKFTSDTACTLIAPDGTSSSLTFTNASLFAETLNPGFYVYLGMQANNAASLNQAVCYSQFSVSGVPSAQSDNFLNDSVLNTNMWLNTVATGPAGIFIMPADAALWLTWNTPAAGFTLQSASNLTSGSWNQLTNDTVITGAGEIYQLVTTNDVPAGSSAAFFQLSK
jgi:hypothetical protein